MPRDPKKTVQVVTNAVLAREVEIRKANARADYLKRAERGYLLVGATAGIMALVWALASLGFW
jgi:hypothetical protein